jgi:hypothetical protein
MGGWDMAANNHTLDSITEPEHRYYAQVLRNARQNLRAEEVSVRFEAATFLLVQPLEEEVYELTSFTGICRACNLNPDYVAKHAFDQLDRKQQVAIKRLLLSQGYHC